MTPVPPKNLNPFARELLERMAGHNEAAEIVIGGGVALSHYLEYRETVDLDSWWRGEPQEHVASFLEQCMMQLAAQHGLAYRRRQWGETQSLELLRGGQKVFSFQISRRSVYLDDAIPARWQPLWIETLRDNAASKMVALVERGAPRDFRDIYELCHRGLLTVADCWHLWLLKKPRHEPVAGPELVLFHLQRLELQRPLTKLPPPDRARPAALREWYREVFCRHTP
jgi:Nucleotidyl transferase AbiEii toxin, Type IV TA system